MADLPRTSGVISIDGVLDDPAWDQAIRIDLAVETEPGENLTAPVATTALLIEDGENLYVGFEASDPNPDVIRAYLRDRDSAWSDDYVGIVLDTYNDERRAFEFYANPLGVQMDKTLDDTIGGHGWNWDVSWDAIWDSAGRITGEGYVVEMRIPLSQLRFPDVEGLKTWGYDLIRFYPRDRTYNLATHPLDRNRSCYLCQVGKLRGLDGSRPSRDLEVVPTLTAAHSASTDEPGAEPMRSRDPNIEAGLTVRWGITPDLTANLTVNPDFSQIEADVAQLDVNNRFTLFFPEKRPFFLEGADYFSTPINAVFTRTVAAPDFGAKLTGKKANNTFGLFAAQDAVTNILFPGLYASDADVFEASNLAVVGRYNRGFADTSSLGALVTLREGDGYHNRVGGIDGRWKINDQHSVYFQHLESTTEYPHDLALEFDQPFDAFDGRASLLAYDYASRDWFGMVRVSDYSSGFRADSGFVERVGGRKQTIHAGRVYHGNPSTWWTRISGQLNYDRLTAEEGELAEERTALRLTIVGALQSWSQVSVLDIRERDNGVLYDLVRYGFYSEFVPRRGLYLEFQAVYGDQIDYENHRLARRIHFGPSASWNMTRNLLLRLRSTFLTLEMPDGTAIFDARLADTRLTWQFNVRSFLRLTVQYQDVERNPGAYEDPVDRNEKDVGRQLLYSFKLNPQTVFFLGYSDRYIDNDSLDRFTAEDRTVFLKIGYAWTP